MTQLSFDLRKRLAGADLLPAARAGLEDELRWVERNAGLSGLPMATRKISAFGATVL